MKGQVREFLEKAGKSRLEIDEIDRQVEIINLFEEEDSQEDDSIPADFLGDPHWYTKVVLANPPVDNDMIDVYTHIFKLNVKDEKVMIAFWQSDLFLDWYCSIDPLLYFERKLGHIVKSIHVEWIQLAKKKKDVIIWAPRDHGKTQTFSRDFALWNADYKYRDEILLISETGKQASKILGGRDSIKEQIENNPKLAHLMPDNRGMKAGAWAKANIKLSNGVRIEAIGFGARSRGMHPGLITADDVLSDQNSMTPDLRQNVLDYWSKTIIPMKTKTTKVILVGTSQHIDDLLHSLSKSKSYYVKKYQAVDEATGKVLWEERHNYGFYQDYRQTYGELAFQKEYQNNPMDDGLSIFPEEILLMALDRSLSYTVQYKGTDPTYIGCDFSQPGGSKRGDGDYTAYMVGTKDAGGVIRLLYYEHFRDMPNSREPFLSKQLQYLESAITNFNIGAGRAEAVGFQSIYTKDYIERTLNIPIEPVLTSRSQKNDYKAGIPFIRTLIETGRLKFPYKNKQDQQLTHKIMAELKGASKDLDGKIVNMTKHDDLMMAIWFMVMAATASGAGGHMRSYNRQGLLKGRAGRASTIFRR